YVRIASRLIPQEFLMKDQTGDGMSDDQLNTVIDRMKQIIAQHDENLIDVTPSDPEPDVANYLGVNEFNDLQLAKLGCELMFEANTIARVIRELRHSCPPVVAGYVMTLIEAYEREVALRQAIAELERFCPPVVATQVAIVLAAYRRIVNTPATSSGEGSG